MIKIVKNVRIYAPEPMGKKDIVIIGNKIGAITENARIGPYNSIEVEVIDAEGKIAIPGFIDSHVHILGGGGEGGFKTRTPEISLSDITVGGVTTIVGCLGTDGVSRNMVSLYAKAKSLEEEGITTYICSGSYRLPAATITGEVIKDMMAIDKVIGVGEIAISDHRSSQPTIEEMKRLAADVRVGGILSGKSGIFVCHVGDGERMLDMLYEIAENTEIPFSQFLPTHINRNPNIFEEGIKYAKAGGYVDFTTSSDPVAWDNGVSKASTALKKYLDAGVPIERITFSSDGQGSLPVFNERKEFIGLGVGKVESLYVEIADAIIKDKIPIETAIRVGTSNPAEILKLKNKGSIKVGNDADIVLLEDESLKIDSVIAMGQIMMRDRKIKVFGTFEKNNSPD